MNEQERTKLQRAIRKENKAHDKSLYGQVDKTILLFCVAYFVAFMLALAYIGHSIKQEQGQYDGQLIYRVMEK